MLLTLLACQGGKMIDHPDDEVREFDYDANDDPLLSEDYLTTCNDGYIEGSRERVFGERLCLAFTDIAPLVGLTDSSQHNGVYTFDYNNDESPDVFISNQDAASNFYTLVDGALNTSAADLGLAYHYEDRATSNGLSIYHPNDVAANDFDSDGDLDLAIAGFDENLVLENNGGDFTPISDPFEVLSGQQGKAVAWIGNDVIFGTDSGVRYFSYSAGTFIDVTEEKNITDQDRIGALAVCDLDADGDDDFFVAKETGSADRFFVNEGSNFSDASLETDTMYPATEAACVTLIDDETPAITTTRNGSDTAWYCDDEFACEDNADILGLTSPNNTTSATYTDLTGEAVTSIFKTNFDGANELLIPAVDDEGNYSYYSDFSVLTDTAFVGASTGSGALDFDGDDKQDIISVSEDGEIFLYANKSRFLE